MSDTETTIPTFNRRSTDALGTGIEDIIALLKSVTRSGRELVADSGTALERELAMAVSIAEKVRDESISPELLKDAREPRLQVELRDTAHRALDVFADAVAVVAFTGVRVTDRFAARSEDIVHKSADAVKKSTTANA